MRRAFTAGLTAAALALLLLGCSSGTAQQATGPAGKDGSGDPATAAPPSTYHRYVALGDSYTAGPYVPNTDLARGCLRSDGNYPNLVAQRLHVQTLVDVSCSAATTGDLTSPQNTFRDATVPAQLDALTPDTDLVTLGIGGNDFDLFTTLLQTCSRLRGANPSGDPCTEYLRAQDIDLGKQIARIGVRVGDSLEAIRHRAPGARILLVDYPRIGPAHGTCPSRLPLADGDYPLAGRVSRSLHLALQKAAESNDIGLIQMYDASRGHDVCSDDPWVNGRHTDQTRALAFHPFAEEMHAVADRIVDRLS